MFYLRTGGNGSCKTLFTLYDIRQLQLETGRPVAFNKNFKANPILTEQFGWTLLEDFTKWEEQPKGTIFLIDEAYKDLPRRPNGQQPPKHIERLHEHRSMGYDFFMLCLHPSTIDAFITKAINPPGWHQHLKRVAGASSAVRVLQWDAVNQNCEKFGSGKTAQITTRMMPKECFAWYDSAFIHTGKVRWPKQVWVVLACVLLVPVLGYFAVSKLLNMGKKPEAKTPAAVVVGPMAAGPVSPIRPNDAPHAMTTAEYVTAYQARFPALLHTAPAYDELTKPKRVPLPAACVQSKSKGCKCYTQDATPYETTQDVCKQIAAGGIFLAFAEVPQAAGRVAAAPSPIAPVAVSPAPVTGLQLPVQSSQYVPLNVASMAPALDTKSTIERDAAVRELMRKREYMKN